MVQSLPLALAAASLFLLPPALADGLYTKSSPVLQVSGNNYDSLIAKTNYTVSVFYEKFILILVLTHVVVNSRVLCTMVSCSIILSFEQL